MIKFRNLQKIYKDDIDNYQIKRFERSQRFNFICKVKNSKQKKSFVKCNIFTQQDQRNFNELIQLNESKSHYLLFKINRRGRSAESTLEGLQNSHCQLVLLSLPYVIPNQTLKILIRKKFKQIYLGIVAILRYKKLLNEKYFFYQLNKLTRRRKPSSPISKSPNKRKIQATQAFTFGDETNCSKTTRRISRQPFSLARINCIKEFQNKDNKLTRLRTNSLSQLQPSARTARTSSLLLIRKIKIDR